MLDTRLSLTLSALALVALPGPALAQTFWWPISASTTPDVMNTSFGPRIEDDAWDFHDGIDLPGACGTQLHAVVDGQVVAASNANGTYSSRHLIIQTTDVNGDTLRAVYLHLQEIDPAFVGVTLPVSITRGTKIGKLGDDGAQSCHLHFEIRRNGAYQVNSIHPLHYLPYTDTANWTGPVAATARFNGGNGDLDARLLLSAPSKLEGDLLRIEVDVRNGSGGIIETRAVSFDDKTTISEGSDDTAMFNAQGMAVEGYQAPDMITDGRTDLHYGVLLRSLPAGAASLVARVYDLGGLRSTSAAIAVPTQAAITHAPALSSAPAGWTQIVSGVGASLTVAAGVLTASDTHGSGSDPQVAAYEIALPTNRFQWRATATVEPTAFSSSVSTHESLLLYFGNGANLLASARMRKAAGGVFPGLGVRSAAGATNGESASLAQALGSAREWTVELLRLGTREATAVLLVDGVERSRINWQANATPDRFRLGFARSAPGVTATVEQSVVEVRDSF